MRIRWVVTDESRKFVRLSAWHVCPRLSDLDDIEDMGLSVVKVQHCGPGTWRGEAGSETFEKDWMHWDALHVTCRKEAMFDATLLTSQETVAA
jgi:hypothetical protein